MVIVIAPHAQFRLGLEKNIEKLEKIASSIAPFLNFSHSSRHFIEPATFAQY
jgi:hypothetical protein